VPGWCRRVLLVGGVLAGLLVARPAEAQVDTTARQDSAAVDTLPRSPDELRADSLRADSLRADSLRAVAIRRRAERLADTIKAPMPAWAMPANTDVIERFRWSREELLSTGAMTLVDLFDHVPGLTTFRTSWLAGMHTAAFQGDFRRVRVFMDGLELDAPDPRNDGVADLTDISLTALDEVMIERAAGEVRVWLRSWTVRNVTPYTRTDIFTGDLNTNAFRGMFGRRFLNGALLQFTLQQAETTRGAGAAGLGLGGGGFGGGFGGGGPRGITGDGEVQHLTARVGWARGQFAIDGYLMNTRRTRDSTGADPTAWALPAFAGSRRDAYVRAGYGDPQRGLHLQAIAGTLRTTLDLDERGTAAAPIPIGGADDDAPVIDSTRQRSQRLLQAGYGFGRARVSAFGRWRTIEGRQEFLPGVQLQADRGWLRGTLHGERMGLDSSLRVDATVRAALRPWLVGTVAHSVLRPDDDTDRVDEQMFRVEGALGWRGRWVTGGFVSQAFSGVADSLTGVLLRGFTIPRLLTPYRTDSTAFRLQAAANTGLTFGAHLPVYKDVRLELQGTRWNSAREYRPQTHARAALILQSEWRSRFPRGHFGINARFMHEYRSAVTFVDADALGTASPRREVEGSNVGIALLEIRIQQATLFYQFRNVYGAQYAQVPGVPMPPPFQVYGVRWSWFN
jgi:hypothetical protein